MAQVPESSRTRVRQAIADPDFARKLRRLLPKDALNVPECNGLRHKYPSALLKAIPSENPYCILGILTEELLAQPVVDAAALARLCTDMADFVPEAKVLRLQSTETYLKHVRDTRDLLLGAARDKGDGHLERDVCVTLPGCRIEGHPDFVSGASVFEVKTTGQLKQGWPAFVLQAFAYAALRPQTQHVHIVLPLQAHVWSFDAGSAWPQRARFVEALKAYDAPVEGGDDSGLFASALVSNFPVGYHVSRHRTMRATVNDMAPSRVPFQVFFTKSTRFSFTDEDVAHTFDIVQNTGSKVYVHAPYILNLALEPGPSHAPNYVVESICEHLRVASAMGLHGVVVHTGKACARERSVALQNMRENLLQCMVAATDECPLLLETPAGQGTELLADSVHNLMDFVVETRGAAPVEARDGLAVCMDTCHVHAAGTPPMEYLRTILDESKYRLLLRLIHFNDSKTPQGSRVDRHATPGTGYIDKAQLLAVARVATERGIPMIVE